MSAPAMTRLRPSRKQFGSSGRWGVVRGRGFIRRAAGRLVGSIAWIVLGVLGIYASIAGLAIAWAAITGYKPSRAALTPRRRSSSGRPCWFRSSSESGPHRHPDHQGRHGPGIRDGRGGAVRLLPAILGDGGTIASLLPNLGLGCSSPGSALAAAAQPLPPGSRPIVDVRNPSLLEHEAFQLSLLSTARRIASPASCSRHGSSSAPRRTRPLLVERVDPACSSARRQPAPRRTSPARELIFFISAGSSSSFSEPIFTARAARRRQGPLLVHVRPCALATERCTLASAPITAASCPAPPAGSSTPPFAP